jgi:hypothetical protein
MAYEQKDMSGALFKNDKREKDSHPHAKGSALIDGVEYWVSAWTKEGSKGKFQSLSFQRKEQKQQPTKQQQHYGQASGGNARELDDEIPF